MMKFFNSDVFICIWALTLIIYWPAGVVLSVIGLAADRGKRNHRREKWA